MPWVRAQALELDSLGSNSCSLVLLTSTLPQFPHLYNAAGAGGKNDICLVGWLLKEVIFPTGSRRRRCGAQEMTKPSLACVVVRELWLVLKAKSFAGLDSRLPDLLIIMRPVSHICFLELVRGFLLLCFRGNKLQGMPRACVAPPSPLSPSPSGPALPPPSVCPTPTLCRLFRRRLF